MIDPDKIMRVLKILKESGNPFYQFCDDFNIDSYKERCREEDKQGYELLFDSDSESPTTTEVIDNFEKVDEMVEEEEAQNLNPEDEYDKEIITVQSHEKDGNCIIDIFKEKGNFIRVTIPPEGEEQIEATEIGNEKDLLDEVNFILKTVKVKAEQVREARVSSVSHVSSI